MLKAGSPKKSGVAIQQTKYVRALYTYRKGKEREYIRILSESVGGEIWSKAKEVLGCSDSKVSNGPPLSLSLSLSDVVHFDIFPWLLAATLKHGKLVM